MRDDGVASTMIRLGLKAQRGSEERKALQESHDCQGEEENAPEIGETSSSEDVASLIDYSVSLRVRVVKVVIRFRMIQ